MSIALMIALALALDYLLGETRRYHPLVGFGAIADALETRFSECASDLCPRHISINPLITTNGTGRTKHFLPTF